MLALAVSGLGAPLEAHAQSVDSARVKNTEPFFTLQDAALAGGFVLGTIALAQVDARLAQTLQDPGLQESGPVEEGARFFRFMGSPGPAIIGVLLYGVGRTTHQRSVAALGLHGLEAVALAEAFVKPIKGFAGRARPFVQADTAPNDFVFLRGFREGRDFSSFPSGHTAAAFAAAATTTAEAIHWADAEGWWSGWKYVIGGTLFTGATLVGISRMYHDEHWASDVIGGAAIGTFSGFKVVKYAYRHPDNRIDRWLLPLTMAPSPDGSGGVLLAWRVPVGAGALGP
jgi:membrane-associated phospholipid phosphatase